MKETIINVRKKAFKQLKGIRFRKCYVCGTPECNEVRMRKKRFCESCGKDFLNALNYRTGEINWKKLKKAERERKRKIASQADLLIKR